MAEATDDFVGPQHNKAMKFDIKERLKYFPNVGDSNKSINEERIL